MFDQRGRLVACQRDLSRIIAFDIATTNVTVLASNFQGTSFIGPNDLVVDSNGGAVTEAGALTVSAGGATITGNSTVTGTLGGLTGRIRRRAGPAERAKTPRSRRRRGRKPLRRIEAARDDA